MNFLQEYSGAISAAATLLIAIFTGTLWRSTGRLWKMTKTSVDAVRQAERAYVKMSHTAPAFDLVKTIGQGGLTVEIKNSGRTPATVTDVLLQVNWFGEENPAPNEPEYRIDARRISVGFFWRRKNLPFMKSVCKFRMKVMEMSFGFMVTSITLTSLISIIEPDMFESI